MNLFGFRKQTMETVQRTTTDHEFLPSVLTKLNGLLIVHLNSIWTKLDDDVGKMFYVFNNNLHFYKIPIDGKLQITVNPENVGEIKISTGTNIFRIKHDKVLSNMAYDVSAGTWNVELLGDYNKLIPLFVELRIVYPIINNR